MTDIRTTPDDLSALPRTLGAIHLIGLGIGGIVGTGIFVLTAEAAQRAGPGMLVAFVLAAVVATLAALCYAELAATMPVAGSAYTFARVAFGDLTGWLVGWALVLEYGVAAAAVAVGWSGYIVGLIERGFGLKLPLWATAGLADGGVANLPAAALSLAVTWLLVRGARESATLNVALVLLKIVALLTFIALAAPAATAAHFEPFLPLGGTGVAAAAASMFFAFVGFDAVSTAAEETRDPQRNLPIGLVASTTICVGLYMFVGIGAIGAGGAQPVRDAAGVALEPGSAALGSRCLALGEAAARLLPCSHEALADVLRVLGHAGVGNFIEIAAALALPSVVLTMMFGQTRVFFTMARDGFLPAALGRSHPRYGTPHVVTIFTGLGVTGAATFFPVGQLADISNAGTLFAFVTVAGALLVLRRREPTRRRPFRVPAAPLIVASTIGGCLGLFVFLAPAAQLLLPAWSALGLIVYVGRRSRRRVGLEGRR